MSLPLSLFQRSTQQGFFNNSPGAHNFPFHDFHHNPISHDEIGFLVQSETTPTTRLYSLILCMDSTPVVLDISSDEEEKGSGVGLKSVDYDWIREFLGMSDDDSDDSDEVVIIHENKPPQPKPKSSTVAVKDVVDDGGDDDDCVVLDGDPEKGGVTCVDDDDEANESDELVVVGEKGQVACRDYPHARHLCAKFPFSSTPHATHCEQCHCYVCDSLAPCLMWGSGVSSSDHCHANDKIEIWKIQRKNLKLGYSSPLPASTNLGTSLLAGHRQHNEIQPVDVIHLPLDSMIQNQASRSTAMHTYTPLNSVVQNQASRPTRTFAHSPSLNSGVHNLVPNPNNSPVVYSAAPNVTIMNGSNLVGYQQTGGSTLVSNRYQAHPVARQWLGVRRLTIPRDRGNGTSNIGPQIIRSNTMPNRLASTEATMTVNHSGNVSSGFSYHANPVQQTDQYHTATGFLNDRNRNNPNQVWSTGNLPLYPNQSSETQAYNQPLSQPNNSHDFYQSCIQGLNDAPPSYAACLNVIQHGSEQHTRNQNENASGNITQSGITSQGTNQPKPEEKGPSETARGADISAFNSSWTENPSQSSEPLVECSHPPASGSTNQPPNVIDMEASIQTASAGSTVTPTDCTNIPSPLSDFESLLLEKDIFQRAGEGALSSELNIPSPEYAPVDTDTLLSEWW